MELPAIAWALEHFKYYPYGNKFTLQTDHQALLSALKNNKGNKTYQSRLSRWLDGLLPFNFALERIPGKNMGCADYSSRHPSGPPVSIIEDDEKFVVNLIQEIKHAILKQCSTPVEAHFGRKPNTEISNITTKTSHKNLSYKNLTKDCSSKTPQKRWRRSTIQPTKHSWTN